MGLIDAFWHVLNLFAPATGMGMIAAGMAKLFWRRELKSVRWWRLALWSSAANAAVLIAGLVITGRDGRMGTYVAMVVACAAALWWAGFRAGGR